MGLVKLKQYFSDKRQHVSAVAKNNDEVVRVTTKSLISMRRKAESVPMNAFKIIAPNNGAYLSPFKGRGMEFEEARQYQPGDDVRNMDWRVTARTGVTHTKVFREERERSVLLWVDYCWSMFFATQGVFKVVQAARAATLLAWSAIQHGDRLGGLVFSEKHHYEIKPQRGDKAVLHFINQLSVHPAMLGQQQSSTNAEAAEQALVRLRRVARPGSMLVLISDFRNMSPRAESHLMQLSRHNDVIMLFIYDPLECQLPPDGLYKISNGDKSLVLNTGNTAIRENHYQQFVNHQNNLKTLARRYGMFFLSCATNQDLETTLQRGLGLRRK